MDSAAKFLIDDLLSRGINTFFGIPGGPIGPLFEAILRDKSIRLIESKHETAAVFEAIGYYKSTGKIPVVLVGGGPGLTNTLTGIASAKALRIPLILISGDVAWEKSNQILLQTGGPDGIDIEKTFEAHTEKVLRLRDPNTVSQESIQLIENSEGNAPLLIVLPLHIGRVKIERPFLTIEAKINESLSIDKDLLSTAANKIAKASRPLLVIGYGARTASNEVLELINTLKVPFVSTPMGKGIVPDTHNLSLRHAGLGASQWARAYLKNSPDVILVLGTDLDDCAVGTTEFASNKTEIIHVDLNPKVFGRKYPNTLGIVADVKSFASQLNHQFRYEQLESSHDSVHLKSIKCTSPFDVADPYLDDSVPIAPHRALADIQRSLSPGYRYVTDIGEHMLFCLHYLTIHDEDNFSIDLGLGSMGSGICTSIGMAIGDRKPTICVVGDGGMQMHGMEILTAIKENLPIVFVVFNDARYGMVHHGFKYLFDREENPGKTDYINFVKFAEAIGIEGHLVSGPGQLSQQLLNGCFSKGRPVIIDVRIDKEIRIKGAGRNEALKHMGEYSE